jgi:hypothetical protein
VTETKNARMVCFVGEILDGFSYRGLTCGGECKRIREYIVERNMK